MEEKARVTEYITIPLEQYLLLRRKELVYEYIQQGVNNERYRLDSDVQKLIRLLDEMEA